MSIKPYPERLRNPESSFRRRRMKYPMTYRTKYPMTYRMKYPMTYRMKYPMTYRWRWIPLTRK